MFTALDCLVAQARARGGGPVRWVVSRPTDEHDQAAAATGLTERRDLFQLRRPLPVEPAVRAGAPSIATRALRPGTADEAAWIEQNNRSFAHHPDQGGQTLDSMHATMAEPWFDPDGLRLMFQYGQLVGSCWTRIHPAGEDQLDDPALGEIFVIGVHPAHGGKGLGAALVLDGLAWLHAHGLDLGMLYVDADNAPALRLYDRLGFTRHHVDRVYDGTVSASRR